MILTQPNTITIDGLTAQVPDYIWEQCNDKKHEFHKEAKEIAHKIIQLKNGLHITQ